MEMQETTCQVGRIVLAALVMACAHWTLVFGEVQPLTPCAATRPSSSWSDRLYADLHSKHASVKGRALPNRGLLDAEAGGRRFRVVWMSGWGAVGAAVVGVYDDKLRLIASRVMKPVLSVEIHKPKGMGDVIAVREESARGVGLRSETLYLFRCEDLATPAWTAVVFDWLEGVAERNEGRLVRHTVLYLDTDGDGTDELLDVQYMQVGDDSDSMLLSEPSLVCSLFKLDGRSGTFRKTPALPARLAYPSPKPTAVGIDAHDRGRPAAGALSHIRSSNSRQDGPCPRN